MQGLGLAEKYVEIIVQYDQMQSIVSKCDIQTSNLV